MKKIGVYGIPFFVVLMFVSVAPAQQSPDDMQQKAAAIKQSAAQNQAALHQYQWVETTQVAMKGEVKSTTQKSCHYGSDGKVQKVPTGSQQPQEEQQSGGGRHGRLKAKIVEQKKEEMTEYMKQAADLVHQYVPPAPDKIQNAVQSGKVSVNPSAAPGLISLIFKDYHLPGDSMTISITQADKKMTNLSVNTYLEKPEDAVTLNVSFAALPDGASYAGQTVLDVAAKNMRVTVSNSNYQKTGN
jgi:hypothetical protein